MIAHISEDGLKREESVAEHTQKTAYLCSKKGDRCGLPQFMALCGLLHDMGKNKQVFDDYLHADETIKQKRRGTIAHASTGAKYIYDRYHNNRGISNMSACRSLCGSVDRNLEMGKFEMQMPIIFRTGHSLPKKDCKFLHFPQQRIT